MQQNKKRFFYETPCIKSNILLVVFSLSSAETDIG